MNLIKPQLDATGVNITLEFDSGLKYRGFQKEFEQVIINFIANSRDAYLEKKSIKKEIIIKIKDNSDDITMTIEDHAGGINKKIIDRIFDPYFTSKAPGKGTGIGLYMSKMIIEKKFGGEIQVKNKVYGTLFTITLPIVENQ